jgi:hypothetical protein
LAKRLLLGMANGALFFESPGSKTLNFNVFYDFLLGAIFSDFLLGTDNSSFSTILDFLASSDTFFSILVFYS